MFRVSLQIRDNTLTTVSEQLARPLILDTIQELNKIAPLPDRPGIGRWALSIPFEDWLRLREKYPDLANKDAKIKSAAYMRFINSAESAPFKVRAKV